MYEFSLFFILFGNKYTKNNICKTFLCETNAFLSENLYSVPWRNTHERKNITDTGSYGEMQQTPG